MKKAIEEATGLGDACDVALLKNITSRWKGSQMVDGKAVEDGTYNDVDYTQINDTTYLDATQIDGYKKINEGAAVVDYDGKRNTAKFVEHANKIINSYLGKTLPTTHSELIQALTDIVEENSSASNPNQYECFYYPMCYGCYLFEPVVKGELSDVYKKNQWYVASEGELCRIFNFVRLGITADKANFNADSEALTPIFANGCSKAGVSVFNTINYWNVFSSTEYSGTTIWSITVNNNLWQITRSTKGYRFMSVCTPCCSVEFILDN